MSFKSLEIVFVLLVSWSLLEIVIYHLDALRFMVLICGASLQRGVAIQSDWIVPKRKLLKVEDSPT